MNRRSLFSLLFAGFALLQGIPLFGGQKQKVKVIKFAGANWISNADELFEGVIGEPKNGLIDYEVVAWLPEENAVYVRLDHKDKLAYGLVKIRKRKWCNSDSISLYLKKTDMTCYKDIKPDYQSVSSYFEV